MAIVHFDEILKLLKKSEKYLKEWELGCPAEIELIVSFDDTDSRTLVFDQEEFETVNGIKIFLLLDKEKRVVDIVVN